MKGRGIRDWKKILSDKENKKAFINYFGIFIYFSNETDIP